MNASHRPQALSIAGRGSQGSLSLMALVLFSAGVAGSGCFLDRNPAGVDDPSLDSGVDPSLDSGVDETDSGNVRDAEVRSDGGRLLDGGPVDAGPVPPGQPGTPTFSELQPTSVRVSWTIPTVGGPVESYRLFRSNSAAMAGPPVGDGLVATTALQEGLTAETTYWYRVQAVNAAGEGPMSEPAEVTTLGPLQITRRQVDSGQSNNHRMDFPTDPAQGNLLVVIAAHRRDQTGIPTIGEGWTLRASVSTGGFLSRRGLSVWSRVAGASETREVEVDWNSSNIDDTRLIVQEFEANAAGTWEFVDAAVELGEGREIESGMTGPIDGGELLLVGAYGARDGSGAVSFDGLEEAFAESGNISAATAFARRTEGGGFETTANSSSGRDAAAALLVFRFAYDE